MHKGGCALSICGSDVSICTCGETRAQKEDLLRAAGERAGWKV